MLSVKSLLCITILICYIPQSFSSNGIDTPVCVAGLDCVCRAGEDRCIINCGEDELCKKVNIGCESANTESGNSCQINCDGCSSCANSCISANGARDVFVNCRDDSACKGATIECDATDDCNVNCKGDNACAHTCIEGPQTPPTSADDLEVNCIDGHNVCKGAIIICPPRDADDNGNIAKCELNCDKDTSTNSCDGITVITNGNILTGANQNKYWIDTFENFVAAGFNSIGSDPPKCEDIAVSIFPMNKVDHAASVGIGHGNSIDPKGNALNNEDLSDKIGHDAKYYDGDKTINYTVSLSKGLSMSLWGMMILFILVCCVCWLAKGKGKATVNDNEEEIEIKEVYE